MMVKKLVSRILTEEFSLSNNKLTAFIAYTYVKPFDTDSVSERVSLHCSRKPKGETKKFLFIVENKKYGLVEKKGASINNSFYESVFKLIEKELPEYISRILPKPD